MKRRVLPFWHCAVTGKQWMRDETKSKTQLIHELDQMRQRLARLEEAELGRVQAELQRDAALLTLQDSEERYQTVAQFTADWEYWIGPDGAYLYISPACEWITGYRADEFQQDPRLLQRIAHVDDRALVSRHLDEALHSRAETYLEFRIQTRNGDECWLEHICQPVYSADGRYLGQRASNRDITERVQAAKGLRSAAKLSQRIFDTIPEAIIVTDPVLNVTSCNQSVQRVLGYGPKELIGQPFGILLPEETDGHAFWHAQQTRLFEQGYLEQEEFQFAKKGGEPFPGSFSAALLRDGHSDFAGVVYAIRDITDLKKAEAALHKRNRQQDQLLKTARNLTASLDVKEVLTRIASGAMEILGAFGCTVYLLEADSTTLAPVVAIEKDFQEEILGTQLTVEGSFTGQAVKLGRALVFNDAATNDLGHHIPGTPVELEERIVVAPFVVEGRVLGAMCLNRIGTEFSQEDLALAETFATYASTILKNAQTHDALQLEVDERIRAEAALRTERDKAQGYLDIAGVMLLALNRQGEITLINRKGHAILGYDDGDLVGRNWFETCLPERSQEEARSIFDALLSGEIELVEYYENPVLTRLGEERVIAWHNTVLERETGEILGTLSSGEDITERLRAEVGLRRRNREMVLLNRVIMAATSPLDVQDVLQLTCQELAHAFGLLRTTAALLNADGTEATVVAEYRVSGRRVDLGKTIPVESQPGLTHVLIHKAPLVVGSGQKLEQRAEVTAEGKRADNSSALIVPILVARGRIAGTIRLYGTKERAFSEEEIGLAQNVAAAAGKALETARLYQALQRNVETLEGTVAQRTAELQVALERSRDADRVKSEFVSNVSHELRAPLSNLKLYLGLLDRGREEKRAAYLTILRRETDRLQDLIEALLDVSRFDLGKTRANLEPVDLNLLITTLVTDREALVADRGLALDVELMDDLPLAEADPRLMEQVFTNLLTNAVNYTPSGGTITLRTETREFDGKGWVVATVTDTGPGISKEEQAHLFERFYRGKTGRASSAPGTGLGLAISREIINLHRGRITVDSQVGRGSSFAVWVTIMS